MIKSLEKKMVSLFYLEFQRTWNDNKGGGGEGVRNDIKE